MKKSFLTVFIFAASAGGFSRILLAQNTVEPTVTIYTTNSHASEAWSETGTFTVRRTGSTNFPLAVFYQLSGSASNGVDYEQLGHSVQIPAGALLASFTVKPIDDSLVEGNESVVAQITGSPLACATCGYTIGVPSIAEVIIEDNDLGGTNHPPFVQLNAPRDGDVFRAPARITLQAYAQDTEDHYDLRVEFFAGTISLGFGTFEATLCPDPYCPYYSLTWSNVPAGEYVLRAKATDSQGATGVSAVVHVFVVETNNVQQPVVNISAIDDTGREIPVVPPWLGMVQEGDPIVFTVTRSGPTNFPLTVFYSVGGTASNGVDYFYRSGGFYDGLPGHVTIPVGAWSADILVAVIDDHFVEGTETVELTLQPPVCIQIFPPPPDCYLVGPSNHAIAKILDNDLTPAPVVTVVATDPDASESGPNTGTFTVSRTGDTSNPLPVFYTIGGTAGMGADYLTFSNFEPFFNAFGLTNVVIPAGASSADITVTPIDDSLAEGSETVVLQLQPQPWASYIVGVPSNAVVIIADNDRVGTNHPPFVQLNAPRNGDVFIAPATIALRAYAQDAEDGVNLKVEFFEGTNRLGFGTFVPGFCPVCPFFALNWSNVPPGNYTLTAKATDNGGASSASAAAHITVFDGVNIYASDPDAYEDPAAPNIDPPTDAAIFTVRRFGETNMGIVVYYEVSGTASNGVDYLSLPGQVTIPAGASSAQIVVRPLDDNLVEGSETVVLTLLPPCPQCLFANPMCDVPQGTNCYPIGPDNEAVAYLHDNDTGSNLPPGVRMVRPADGETFQAHSDIQLIAFAQDSEDSYFVQVEFFEGTHTLGFGTFFPGRCAVCPNYGITWSNVPPGEYVLRAKATDSHGAMSVSDPVRISVTGTNAPVLQFLEPTNNAVFSTLDEIPILLRAFAPDDVFPTADVLANGARIATASYCCWLCPCFHPVPGQELILPIPVPRQEGMPWTRTWQGWTNVQPGTYRLTARAVGENGTVIESAPVNITVLDLTLRIFVRADGSVTLVIPQGSLVAGGYDAEASQDLRTWTRLGPFQPGNVAAFYFDDPPASARARRFYRSVRVPPRQP